MTKAHMDAFSGQQRGRFEDEMAVCLAREYPQQVAELGDDDLRELIRCGLDKAERYNIFLEPDVARFLALAIALGCDFDEDRATPWAKPILSARSATAVQKLDRLEAKLFESRRGWGSERRRGAADS